VAVEPEREAAMGGVILVEMEWVVDGTAALVGVRKVACYRWEPQVGRKLGREGEAVDAWEVWG
jgi:hypothetical protein